MRGTGARNFWSRDSETNSDVADSLVPHSVKWMVNVKVSFQEEFLKYIPLDSFL